ncbi:hypothetical protein ABIB37_001836 [Agrococcus sp. UYP10]|uniref:hypothetical protein n=1 Tax=Agrococcus sp. UYP10 TaxID=1756355 RepID=UPI0033913D1D
MDTRLVVAQVAIGFVLAFCLWAQLFPRSNWRLFWSWQYRFSHVRGEREQIAFVRRLTVLPIVVCVILTVIIQVWG